MKKQQPKKSHGQSQPRSKKAMDLPELEAGKSPTPTSLQKRPSAADIEHCEDSEECETWWDFFKMFDKDHDGYIPTYELKRAVAKNRHFFHIEIDELHRLVDNCDVNGDALIDFPEFCEIMLKTKNQRLKRATVAMGNAVLPKKRQAKATSYLVEYTCWPPPLFIVLISILEITMYFWEAVGTYKGVHPYEAPPIYSNLTCNPHRKGEVWRYFTYTLTHNGYIHLLSNVIMQLLLGIPLELVHNGLRVASIYYLGALSGALLFFISDGKTTYLVGASGGVYSLITAHLADVFLNWSEMPFRWVRIAFFGVWVAADFGYALYDRFGQKNVKVAFFGHLGGAIAGLFLGIVILRNLETKTWERVAWWISLGVFIIYMTVCIILVIAT